jgi:hypothetical protein
MLTVRMAISVFALIMPAFRYSKLWERRNIACFVDIGEVSECKSWLNKEDGGEEDWEDDDAVMVHNKRSGRGVIEGPRVGLSLCLL